MTGDLNLGAAIGAGSAVVDNYLDRNLNRGEQIAREVIEAALPHLLEVVAAAIETKRDWWCAELALTYDRASYFTVAARTVRQLAAAPADNEPITIPWDSTPDYANDYVSITRTERDGEYFVVSAATYRTPQELRDLGHACLEIAKLPAPEALPPVESHRPRRRYEGGHSCAEGV